jgi:hypothetical protein
VTRFFQYPSILFVMTKHSNFHLISNFHLDQKSYLLQNQKNLAQTGASSLTTLRAKMISNIAYMIVRLVLGARAQTISEARTCDFRAISRSWSCSPLNSSEHHWDEFWGCDWTAAIIFVCRIGQSRGTEARIESSRTWRIVSANNVSQVRENDEFANLLGVYLRRVSGTSDISAEALGWALLGDFHSMSVVASMLPLDCVVSSLDSGFDRIKWNNWCWISFLISKLPTFEGLVDC